MKAPKGSALQTGVRDAGGDDDDPYAFELELEDAKPAPVSFKKPRVADPCAEKLAHPAAAAGVSKLKAAPKDATKPAEQPPLSRPGGRGAGAQAAAAGSEKQKQKQPAASKTRRKATASKNKFLQNVSSAAEPVVLQAPDQSPGSPAKLSRMGSVINPSAMMRMAHGRRSVGWGDGPSQEPAAAKSVMEAQVRGEELQVVDDATYALDGLGGSSKEGARRENAAVLATICTGRRGLGALSAEGIMPEVFGALGACVASSGDAVVALCAAAVVLGAAQPAADPGIICGKEAMALVSALASDDRLLQPVDSKALATAPGLKRLRVLLCEGPLSRQLPAALALVPAAVALAAVASASDPHNESRAGSEEQLKEALQSSGALRAVAMLSNRTASGLPLLRANPQAKAGAAAAAALPGAEDLRRLEVLQLCMLIMEHATFCFLDNVKHLCSLQVPCPPWAPAAASTCLFAEAGARIVQRLSVAWERHPAPTQAPLRACLSVLMNLTHSNATGAKIVSACGLCESAAELLEAVCGNGHGGAASLSSQGCSSGSGSGALRVDRGRLVAGLELLTIALGLLINLAEGEPKNKTRLSSWRGGAILEFLVHIVTLSAQEGGGGGSRAGQPANGGADDEVTADDLEVDEADGEASIVEVYAAMLLGFLVEDDRHLRKRAEEMLPGRSLDPVIGAIERCLDFYVRTDTIAESTTVKLKKLISSLKRQL